MWPSLLAPFGIVAEGVVEAAEVRQVGHVGHQRLHPRREGRLLRRRRPAARRCSISRERSASTLIRSAASLRVLLMLVWTRMLLRDVLLSWMSKRSASRPLNCVPSKPAEPQMIVSRVGSSANSSLSQRLDGLPPGRVRRAVVLDAGRAELRRDHLLRRGHVEVLRDERVRVDLPAQAQGELGHLHRQLVTLQLHLPPGDVERGDDLEIRRGRGVGEERLLERPLHLVEVVVPHQDHRALPERGHRLVGRVGLVHADAHLVRIGQEVRVEAASAVVGVELAAPWRRTPCTARGRRDRDSARSAWPPRPWPCAGGGTG